MQRALQADANIILQEPELSQAYLSHVDGDEPADSDLEGLDLDAIHGLGEEGSDSGSESQSDSDEDDAALARLLEEVGGQEGRPHSKKRRRAELEDEEDEDNDIYYTDFFGRGKAFFQEAAILHHRIVPGGSHIFWRIANYLTANGIMRAIHTSYILIIISTY